MSDDSPICFIVFLQYSFQNIDTDRFYVKNIVADMRKVLAKNPQVEQQKLHRRVFLDNVDPENQALLVSFPISVFNIVFPFVLVYECRSAGSQDVFACI